jgi:NMD protein affecting ribosome stability and mRNA decay
MYLTHKCPDCGRLHEHESTPEPDKLCPDCDVIKYKVLKPLPFAKVGDLLEYDDIYGLWVERKFIQSTWLDIDIANWIKTGWLERVN